MKLRFLFFAAFLSLVSCSDDNYIPRDNKQLKNIITFYNDGDREADVKTTFYNDLPSRRYTYKDGQDFSTEWFVFDTNTMYLASYYYYQNDVNNSLGKRIYYDEENRIKTIKEDFNADVYLNSTFDYSVPGEITMHQQKDDSGTITTKQTLYSLNPMGNIYKITSFDEDGNIVYVSEAEYVGDVLTSVTTVSYVNNMPVEENVVNYNYDTSLVVKGGYLNMAVSQLGTNNNSILYYNGFEVFKESYLLKIDNTTLEYELDRDNFPVKETILIGGEISKENIITYE